MRVSISWASTPPHPQSSPGAILPHTTMAVAAAGHRLACAHQCGQRPCRYLGWVCMQIACLRTSGEIMRLRYEATLAPRSPRRPLRSSASRSQRCRSRTRIPSSGHACSAPRLDCSKTHFCGFRSAAAAECCTALYCFGASSCELDCAWFLPLCRCSAVAVAGSR